MTISNPSEFGEVYTPEQTRAICETAHELGYAVHVDGARFACAVAHLGCEPHDLTVAAGVDALTFGGTKNGLACGEAVLFFPQGDGKCATRATRRFPYHRKSTGHLVSKHRFLTAPFVATLKDGAWLRHAGNANALAGRLAADLIKAGHVPRYPTESNAVFVTLPEQVHKALAAAGHNYYVMGDPKWKMARFMMSFDTTRGEVDQLVRNTCAVR